MRGIVLAGGSGTRLWPMTAITSKQLLPVYDKPLVYYPLSILMLAGIRDILFISTPAHLDGFRHLFGDGSDLGLRLDYAEQDYPRGLADALRIGRDFVGDDQLCLILGDNIFYGHDLAGTLRQEVEKLDGCTLFGYPVADPQRYGVAVFDAEARLVDIEEKPEQPRSSLAITGLYLYDNEALDYATELTPSARGELEITELNRRFVREGRARLVNLGRGTAWLDTGTCDSLLEAASFIQVLQKRQGVQIACLEEVAYRVGFIGADELTRRVQRIGHNTAYGQYVASLLEPVVG